nr:TonB-dependent receptor [Thauera linaloolentis]
MQGVSSVVHIRPARIRLGAIAAGLCLAFAAHAQTAARPIDLPAAPLERSLNTLARQAGVQILFAAPLAAGRSAPALKGDYTAQQALERLLAGTGLVLRRADERTFRIEDGAGKETTLSAVTVSASANRSGTTEGTGSYTTGVTSAATRMNLSIRETPQSISVMTRQRIEDQKMNTLNDVVKNTPGLTMQELGAGRQRYLSRGTLVDNLMYDGLPITIGGSAVEPTGANDMAIYDHVEIVRGATGIMQGAGNPSASINLVRKKPTATSQVSVSTSAGSWDRYRAELDASGPLNDAGSLRGRVVAAYQNHQSFQDVVQNERSLFYGVFDADITDSTTLTFGASRQKDNNGNGYGGIPVAADGSDLHLPRSTFLGYDWEFWDRLNETAFVNLEHHFDNGWKLNLKANKVWSKLDQTSTLISNYGYTSSDIFNQEFLSGSYKNRQGSYDFYASGPFNLLNQNHELVFGLSKRDEAYSYRGIGILAWLTNVNLGAWDHSSMTKPNLSSSLPTHQHQTTDIEQKSAYVTTRLKLSEPITLILGGRLDWYEHESSLAYGSYVTNSAYKVTRNLTKYAGLIYDLNDKYSVYASYTDIFKPQDYISASGSLIDPVLGKNYEVGLKSEYFDGLLNASVSLFRMNQENRATRLQDQTQCATFGFLTCYEAAGKVRSQGIDLEIQGALTPSWQIGAGYTYTKTKYIKDVNKSNEGQPFDTDLPKHLLKLTTTYTLPDEFQRWRVGASLYRQSKIYNKGSTYHIEQKSYNLVDIMLSYSPTNHIDTQLNFNNIFDKRYYQTITSLPSAGQSVYGAPRNIMLNVKYKF